MAGYWVVKVRVSDAESYGEYAKLATAAVANHGGRFIVRGQPAVTKEGEDFPRNVVIEFPSRAAAEAFYNDPAYEPVRAIRWAAAESELILVDGV